MARGKKGTGPASDAAAAASLEEVVAAGASHFPESADAGDEAKPVTPEPEAEAEDEQDPFAMPVSQANAEPVKFDLPTLQYLGSPQVGAPCWFIEDTKVLGLGLPLEPALPGFRVETRFLGNKDVKGWVADTVTLHALRVYLRWVVEWEEGNGHRRFAVFPRWDWAAANTLAASVQGVHGGQARPVGKFYALVMCKELGPHPVVAVASGTCSAALDMLLGDATQAEYKSLVTKMMEAATAAAKAAGRNQLIPREMFAIPVAVGPQGRVGGEGRSSPVQLPKLGGRHEVPAGVAVTADFARLFVSPGDKWLWGPEGLFEVWLGTEHITEAWESRAAVTAQTGEEPEAQPLSTAAATPPAPAADSTPLAPLRAIDPALTERLGKASEYFYGWAGSRGASTQQQWTKLEWQALGLALQKHGFEPSSGTVTSLIHRFGGEAAARRQARLDIVALTLFLNSEKQAELIDLVWPNAPAPVQVGDPSKPGQR